MEQPAAQTLPNIPSQPSATPSPGPLQTSPVVTSPPHIKSTQTKLLQRLVIATGILVLLLFAIALWVHLYVGSVRIQDQFIQDTIAIEKVVLPRGGFLVIYRLLSPGSSLTSVGNTGFLYPGTYTNFTIPLSWNDPTTSIAGLLLVGVLYDDTNGNRFYDEQNVDREMKSPLGKPIGASFVAKRFP